MTKTIGNFGSGDTFSPHITTHKGLEYGVVAFTVDRDYASVSGVLRLPLVWPSTVATLSAGVPRDVRGAGLRAKLNGVRKEILLPLRLGYELQLCELPRYRL